MLNSSFGLIFICVGGGGVGGVGGGVGGAGGGGGGGGGGVNLGVGRGVQRGVGLMQPPGLMSPHLYLHFHLLK